MLAAILTVVSFVVQYLAWRQEAPSSDPTTEEDLNRPTVSQSRSIPVVFGTRRVSAPNVLDSGNLRTQEITVKIKSLFGSKREGTGIYRHWLDEMQAIAWGPGTLKGVWFGDFKVWSGSQSAEGQITIQHWFGDPDSDGGVGGTVDFYPGSDTQTPNSYIESALGHNQPGYRGVGYCVFRDFYFGNSPTFKAVSYDWEYLPNPFSHASNYNISGDANPALCLYALYLNDQWGVDTGAPIDTASFQSGAQSCYDEGLGYSRVWYSGSGEDIARDLKEHMGAETYKDPLTGQITLKLIRDDYTVASLDELTETNQPEPPSFKRNELAALATELRITYQDRANNNQVRTPALSNLANRLQLGYRNPVEREFMGASNATVASKLLARVGTEVFYPLLTGKVVADRTAWDWYQGKVFKLSYAPQGLVQAVVRVVKIDRGSLLNGKVIMDVIEDKFSYGSTVFDAPAGGGTGVLTSNPQDVSNYLAFELPVFLIQDDTPQKLALLAAKPTADHLDYLVRFETNNGGFKDDSNGSFADRFLVDAAVSETATSIVVQGELVLEAASASEVAVNGSNLLVIVTSGGMEFVAAESASYNSGTDKTTISGLHRGFLDTHPKAVASLDVLWVYQPFTFSDSFVNTDVVDFKLLTHTGRGELAEGSATERSHTIADRHDKPLPPANIKLNSGYFPTSVTGPVTATWADRDASATTSLVDWDDATDYGPEAGVTYTVTWYNDDTSTQLQQTTGITGNSDSWSDPGQSYNLRVEIKAVRSGTDSHETFVFVTAFSQP